MIILTEEFNFQTMLAKAQIFLLPDTFSERLPNIKNANLKSQDDQHTFWKLLQLHLVALWKTAINGALPKG